MEYNFRPSPPILYLHDLPILVAVLSLLAPGVKRTTGGVLHLQSFPFFGYLDLFRTVHFFFKNFFSYASNLYSSPRVVLQLPQQYFFFTGRATVLYILSSNFF